MKQGIIFEPSASYFHKKNRVLKRTGRTIMNIVSKTFVEKDIDDTL